MRRIPLSMIALSAMTMADFSRSSDGIVTDNTTKLQWQDDYSDNGGSVKSALWEDAIDYCEALTLGGYDDWRLPNFNELYSIVDYTKHNPAIDTTFQAVVSDTYWSSTSIVSNEDGAWGISFYGGHDSYWNNKFNSSYYVRCVRGE